MKALLKTALVGVGLFALASTAQAGVGACLITKNNTCLLYTSDAADE